MWMPEKINKKWTDEQMIAVIKAVEENNRGINQVATAHGVPKTTHKDMLSGSVQHGTKAGPKPYLNDAKESELFTFLKKSSSIG